MPSGEVGQFTDPIWYDNVLTARQMTPEQRLLAGPRLFEFACEIEKWWLRGMHRGANEEEILVLLRQRVDEAARDDTPA